MCQHRLQWFLTDSRASWVTAVMKMKLLLWILPSKLTFPPPGWNAAIRVWVPAGAGQGKMHPDRTCERLLCLWRTGKTFSFCLPCALHRLFRCFNLLEVVGCLMVRSWDIFYEMIQWWARLSSPALSRYFCAGIIPGLLQSFHLFLALVDLYNSWTLPTIFLLVLMLGNIIYRQYKTRSRHPASQVGISSVSLIPGCWSSADVILPKPNSCFLF